MDKSLLVEYYRVKGNLKGVVVSPKKDIIGWSMCDPKDVFSKKRALEIAIARANKMSQAKDSLNPDAYIRCLNSIPRSLMNLAEKMFIRSDRYFKDA